MAFQLHERLAADTFPVGHLPLSRVLLMNDFNFPWCILVPARDGVREIHELDAADQVQLLEEMSGVAASMQTAFAADKMNLAALGNVVPQLHVHVIARFQADSVWPAPVWGRLPAQPYPAAQRAARLASLREAFRPLAGFQPDRDGI